MFLRQRWAVQVPEGLESSIRLMLPGERAVVHSSAKYAYDKFPRSARF